MSRTENHIFKYVLELEECDESDRLSVVMPHGAHPLYATNQGQYSVVMYALVDVDETVMVERNVFVHGTGRPTRFTRFAKPLGVAKLHDGAMMFHVWIEPEEAADYQRALSGRTS